MKTKTIAGLLVITSITTAVSTNAFKEFKDKEAIQAIKVTQEEKMKTLEMKYKKYAQTEKY